jgi:hypothetical protein
MLRYGVRDDASLLLQVTQARKLEGKSVGQV